MSIKNRIRKAELKTGDQEGFSPLRIIWADMEENTYFMDGRQITKEEYEELTKDSQIIEWPEGDGEL